VLFIREIDPDKSERILAILFDKEVSRTASLFLYVLSAPPPSLSHQT
jgi:hypothetical protein